MTQRSSRHDSNTVTTRTPPAPSVGQDLLSAIDLRPDYPADDRPDRAAWSGQLRAALEARSPQVAEIADAALRASPTDPELLLLTALAALAQERPERALVLLKRYGKRYVSGAPAVLLTALALGQQRQCTRAWTMLRDAHLATHQAASEWFVGDDIMQDWLHAQLREIRLEASRAQRTVRNAVPPPPRNASAAARQAKAASGPPATPQPASRSLTPRSPLSPATNGPGAAADPMLPALPRLEAHFDIAIEFANTDAIEISGPETSSDPMPYCLRGELVRLSLFQGFDELLCLSALQGVEAHWYQVETVRKVLKQYRGRVLLADEVGLGKTVEAGMVLKEYILRGMAERILILTPASLVGQWRDEMASKFGIECATSHDPLFRSDPERFWAQPRVIASIAAARRKDQAAILAGLSYDVVVVDEAHHLRDQASASYRLVNTLRKRFLLLLSATPVQNSLLELYNLLTLLQPGIFKTQKEFRSVYMVPGKPREPANRERLRDLMRGVMVRNTRALTALRLPARHASTLRTVPDALEAACYEDLTALVREAVSGSGGPDDLTGGDRATAAGQGSSPDAPHRLALHHLLAAAGSSPAAAAAAIARFAERHPADTRWPALLARTRAITAGAKQAALLRLLAQNPAEKKLVFVHHRDTLEHLAEQLRQQKIAFARFTGDMPGPQKDASVDAFRDSVPVLLCTESGGEGRNLQFCNTLINFDIPWNPMAIEQRIGRIDRIGQTREVFIFNLVTAGTIEDAMLRILDEKINMFELVVGEVGAILGEIDEQHDFSTLMLNAWLQTTEPKRTDALTRIENQLLAARREYDGVKQFDEALFGNDLDAA